MAMIQKKVQEGLGLVEREMEVGKFEYDLIYKTRPDLMILRDVSLSHLYDLLFEGPIVDLGLLRCKRMRLADDHIGWIILIFLWILCLIAWGNMKGMKHLASRKLIG